MNLSPDQNSTEALIPPRPNLGPEPWPDAPGRLSPLAWAALVLALLLGLELRRWRKRRRKRTPDRLALAPDFSAAPEGTPRQRLIASSEVVRRALIRTYGPSWGSKTTEEIAAEPTLTEKFEAAQITRMADLLRLADRVKFASSEPSQLEEWEAWVKLVFPLE